MLRWECRSLGSGRPGAVQCWGSSSAGQCSSGVLVTSRDYEDTGSALQNGAGPSASSVIMELLVLAAP